MSKIIYILKYELPFSFPPPEIRNEHSVSWLYSNLSVQWKDWLPENAIETFKK